MQNPSAKQRICVVDFCIVLGIALRNSGGMELILLGDEMTDFFQGIYIFCAREVDNLCSIVRGNNFSVLGPRLSERQIDGRIYAPENSDENIPRGRINGNRVLDIRYVLVS